MQLYNTLTQKLQTLSPLDNEQWRMYSCGPTMYDKAHIGNLSAYIFADTLRRALAMTGYAVTHVMNYTDVDDKTVKRSRENFPHMAPLEALSKFTNIHIETFMSDMRAVGNDIRAVKFVRATDSIEGIKELITQLYREGYAYIIDGYVYFSIEAYRKSGKVYGQLADIAEQNTSQNPITSDVYDTDTMYDFALWKRAGPEEPVWEFNLDGHDLGGRPGWHIECSVMSQAHLNLPFDIHTGGIDLISPHHENVIAQSTALRSNPVLARHFVHNNYILVDGAKMAKSAGNFYTLQDLRDKGIEPLAFRVLVLQSHYRTSTDFSWAALETASEKLRVMRAAAALYHATPSTESASVKRLDFDTVNKQISLLLNNDLNTAAAFTMAYDTLQQVADNGLPTNQLASYRHLLTTIDQAFGLNLNHVNRPLI